MRTHLLLVAASAVAIAACGDTQTTTTVTVAAEPAPAAATSATTPATATATPPPATTAEAIAGGAASETTADTTEPSDAEIDQAIADAEEVVNAELAATCVKQLRPLADALSELDSRLDVGLNYAQYSELVATAKVKYDRVNWDKGMRGPGCARTAILLERALNKYTAAYRRWNACIESPSCDTDSITTKLQGAWKDATRAVDQAVARLDDLEDA